MSILTDRSKSDNHAKTSFLKSRQVSEIEAYRAYVDDVEKDLTEVLIGLWTLLKN